MYLNAHLKENVWPNLNHSRELITGSLITYRTLTRNA